MFPKDILEIIDKYAVVKSSCITNLNKKNHPQFQISTPEPRKVCYNPSLTVEKSKNTHKP